MTRQTSLPALFARITSKYSIYLILLAMLVICSLLSDAFFSAKNLSNISRQISITTIISFGMTMLIIAGMIDLAAGSQTVFNTLCSDVTIHMILNGQSGVNDCSSRRNGIWGRPSRHSSTPNSTAASTR